MSPEVIQEMIDIAVREITSCDSQIARLESIALRSSYVPTGMPAQREAENRRHEKEIEELRERRIEIAKNLASRLTRSPMPDAAASRASARGLSIATAIQLNPRSPASEAILLGLARDGGRVETHRAAATARPSVATGAALTPDELAVCKALGVSEEAFRASRTEIAARHG